MTDKEYQKLSIKDKAKYFWDNKSDLSIELSNDKKSIKIWVNDMGFDAREVFAKLHLFASLKATINEVGNPTKSSEAILVFCQVKSEILGLIVAINDISKMNSLDREDYSDIILSINSYITWAVSELDSELKDSQIETNKISIETNKSIVETNRISNSTNIISKDTNRYIAMFTGIAGLWYLYDFIYKILPEMPCLNKEILALPISIITISCIVILILKKGEREQR